MDRPERRINTDRDMKTPTSGHDDTSTVVVATTTTGEGRVVYFPSSFFSSFELSMLSLLFFSRFC